MTQPHDAKEIEFYDPQPGRLDDDGQTDSLTGEGQPPKYAAGDQVIWRCPAGDIPAIIREIADPPVAGIWYYYIDSDHMPGNTGVPETELLDVPAPTVFRPLSFSELLSMPDKEWLVGNMIGAGDIGIVFGAPGCGKTFAIIDLTLSASLGRQWAMRFDITSPLNVAYCAGEGISGLPARFRAAAQHYGVTDLPNFTFFSAVPQLFADPNDATAVTIHQFVTEWKSRQAAGQAQGLHILIVDTLHTATVAADENSAKDMGKVLHACRWATAELGCAVILVHHTGKAGTVERGSSALRGAADVMIEIKRVSDTGTKATMICSKLKDGEQWKPQTFDLVEMGDSVRVWWDEPSDSVQAQGKEAQDKEALLAEMRRYSGTKFTVKSLAQALDKGDNHIRNLLAQLEKSGDCERELQYPDKEQSNRNPWVYYIVSDT